ncbi:CREA protein [Neorhizobium lilium]|uniref:CREA protein n=1 Tax=Neorhizobium lilium TaxID=2503024 RepID=A0A444LHK7_9HYPH|nr:CreA family protein [Neorhizobium lilium]RWX78469.1 CREA protein [Neorhizobium lilium]
MKRLNRLASAAAISLGLFSTTAKADVVGEVGVDWMGNDIVVEALADPLVKGVTCHVTYFSRGVLDRLKNGNWFEDPSNNSISCRQTGPIEVGDISLSKEGDEVFRQGMSLIFKTLVVNRIYDRKNDTLIYLVHSRQITNGSAKMAVSTIPLYGQNVAWTKGKPQP